MKQAGSRQRVGRIFAAAGKHGLRTRQNRAIIDRSDDEGPAGGHTATIAVDDIIAQADRAVIVCIRREALGAVTIVHDCAMIGHKSGYA